MHTLRASLILVSVLAILGASVSGFADSSHSVHLASYRNEADARSGWQELASAHSTLLAGLVHRIVPVELPGQGLYYRVMAGAFNERSQALKLQNSLRDLGLYAEAMPLPSQPPVVAQGPYRLPAPQRLDAPSPTPPKKPAVAAAPKMPTSPRAATPPAQPVGPASVKNTTVPLHFAAREKPAPQPKASEIVTSLRKFVSPPPVTAKRKQDSKHGTDPMAEGAVREQLATNSPPPGSLSTTPRTSFQDDGASDGGLTLARPRNSPGRIAAIYGDMGSDFEDIPGAVPMKHMRKENEFKPYVGLGISF